MREPRENRPIPLVLMNIGTSIMFALARVPRLRLTHNPGLLARSTEEKASF
jgi:hypothetical protein